MRQLTSLDAQFLALETRRNHGHVSGLAVYDPSTAPGGRIEIADVCRLVSGRLHLLPPFRWKLAEVPFGLDHPYWVEDEDFDLDFHIRESAVPPPGDDRRLAETVARIVARPLDRAHPLWELYLIHGIAGGLQAVLTKVHHAAVDGVSGAEILSVLLDLDREGREVSPPDEPQDGERRPSDVELLARGVAGLPLQPLRAARALPMMLPNVDRIPGASAIPGIDGLSKVTAGVARTIAGRRGDGLERPAVRAPRTRFNGPISPHRRFSFGSLSLDTVKAIKNATGTTVNDVVVALCTTAVREWLRERDELPREPLVAMVPVSVRSQEQVGTFGNRVTAMFVPIPTDVADAEQRLLRTHQTLREAKSHQKAIPADLLQDATKFIPPAIAARAARLTMQLGSRQAVRPVLNLTISNVPGPQFPLYFAGAELVAHYPVSVIVDGAGLNITVMSYRGHLDFGIVMDREQVDDAWPLFDALREALAAMERAVCEPGANGRRRSAGRRPDSQLAELAGVTA
jgi:diacylglycerol O-acyltransferase / wax synthase